MSDLQRLIEAARLRAAAWLCPATHRLVEVGFMTDDEAGDLIRGGDALASGWACDPAILYNGAIRLRAKAAEGGE